MKCINLSFEIHILGANSEFQRQKKRGGSIMSIWPRLGKRQRGVKKSSKPNPYAGRGLDKFASVTAELSARKEFLAAQTGAPVSIVRFTAAPETKWTPVFVSPHRYRIITSEKRFLSPSVSEITRSDAMPAVKDLEDSEASTGVVVSTLSASFPSVIFKFPATNHDVLKRSVGEKYRIGSFFRKNAEKCSKIAMGITFLVAWFGKVATVGAVLTTIILFLLSKQQARRLPRSKSSLSRTSSKDQRSKSEALTMVNNTSPSELRSRASHITSGTEGAKLIVVPSLEKAREESSTKPCKLFRRHVSRKNFNSAPSSPIGGPAANFSSSTPPSPFTGSSTLLPIAARSHAPIQEKKFKRLASSLSQRTKRTVGTGAILMVAGICIAMLGLLSGRCFAVCVLTCWLYTVPMIRQRAGVPRPSVRGHSNAAKQAQKNKNNLVSLGRRKLDIDSPEYKKKVIMDGFLVRSSPTL